MRRPQFSLKALLCLMTVVAVACVVLPRPMRSLKRWLWPPQTFSCVTIVTNPIVILEEDEALLGIPSTDD